jgi:hypothetical protein
MKMHRPACTTLLILLCLAATSSEAAVLVWGTGKWGTDSWASASSGGSGAISLPPVLSGGAFQGQTNPAATTGASFALGLTRDNGQSWLTTARVGDNVKVVGYIKPEAQHIGQKVDVFVVDRLNLAFRMKNLDGVFLPWDGRVPNLVPFIEDVTLTDNMQVNIFTGTLGVSGDHRFFLGYMPTDGVLRYTPNALRLTINP